MSNLLKILAHKMDTIGIPYMIIGGQFEETFKLPPVKTFKTLLKEVYDEHS